MSGFDAEREAIETRFAVQWAGQTPVSYDNSAFNIPQNTPWVRLTILNGESQNASVGTSHLRHIGIISVQVFVPVDSGTRQARLLANSVSTIFDNQRFAGIQCRVSSIQRGGDQDGWHMTIVNTPFRRDEHI